MGKNNETPSTARPPEPRPIVGHTAWTALAAAPDGVALAREEGRLSVGEFRSLLMRSDVRWPVNDPDRLAAMLVHANLVVTARDRTGQLVGVARSLSDFSYCCYLSDLCVDEA